MDRARLSVPAARPLASLQLLLLLLARLSPAVRGDCGEPPKVIYAHPLLQGQTSFPVKSEVTYECDKGFLKIPDRIESTTCLSSGKWSEISQFCNRSCLQLPRIPYATPKPIYIRQNYFPVDSIVEYDCRPGYSRLPSLSGNITCLPNVQWSTPTVFCKKKSCPDPGEIKNGQVNITTDLLFGARILFSCDKGYRLDGSDYSFCAVIKGILGWSDPLPECIEIFCPKPPKINHGVIQHEHENYGYRQSITYVCDKGFTLVGTSSIYCNMNGDQGEWSDQPPQCIATSHVPVTRSTTKFHSTRTSTKGKEISTSDVASFVYGHTCITLTILLVMLVTIG